MTHTVNFCCKNDLINDMKIRHQHRFSGFDYSPDTYFRGFRPKTDISEDSKNLYFEFELPGIETDSIKVIINDDNILNISAEKIDELSNFRRIVKERYFGLFQRSFQLNENIDSSNISATYTDGILKVIVPKKMPEEKVIEIK